MKRGHESHAIYSHSGIRSSRRYPTAVSSDENVSDRNIVDPRIERIAAEIIARAKYAKQNIGDNIFRLRVLDYAVLSRMESDDVVMLFVLHRYGNANGTSITVAVPTLMALLGWSESRVRRSLARLSGNEPSPRKGRKPKDRKDGKLQPWLSSENKRRGNETYAERVITIPPAVIQQIDEMMKAAASQSVLSRATPLDGLSLSHARQDDGSHRRR